MERWKTGNKEKLKEREAPAGRGHRAKGGQRRKMWEMLVMVGKYDTQRKPDKQKQVETDGHDRNVSEQKKIRRQKGHAPTLTSSAAKTC
jgi:hypothetical protein